MKAKTLMHIQQLKMEDKKMFKNEKLLSGFQDFLPSSMLARNELIEKIKKVYERFGFLPQETPCLEYASLLLDKYGDNQKLVYEFKDRGNRQVAMRYDLTVPLGRIIETYGNSLIYPYRRYQIGMVWRADKPGKGRYREFMQMDADIVGDDSLLADAEMLLMIMDIMRSLNIRGTVRINSRQILNSLVEICGLQISDGVNLLRVIDKLDKIGVVGIKSELKNLAFSAEVIATVEKYLLIGGNNSEILASLKLLLEASVSFEAGYNRLSDIVDLIGKAGITDNCCPKIDQAIARGLDYYTGLIFETTFLDDSEFGSICSGGRYDRLIKLPTGKLTPAIGISIGLDRLFAAMESANLISKVKTTTRVFIVNFNDAYLARYISIAKKLRDSGITVEVSTKPIKIAKQMKQASYKEVPFVVLVGENEIATSQVVIKNMKTGEQKSIFMGDLVSYLQNQLREIS